jgi:hypothetical protein
MSIWVPERGGNRYSKGMKKRTLSPLEKEARQVIEQTTSLAATPEQFAALEAVAMEWNRRILETFNTHPEGEHYRVGLVGLVAYFSALGYWRGYKEAKWNYATLDAAGRTPHGRERINREVSKMLEDDLRMTAKQICQRLDEMDEESPDPRAYALSFDTVVGKKQKSINVGHDYKNSWATMHREPAIKMMISRIRDRIRKEKNAAEWMKKAETALT